MSLADKENQSRLQLKNPVDLWESADVDVSPAKRCFAVESSQAEGARSWAG